MNGWMGGESEGGLEAEREEREKCWWMGWWHTDPLNVAVASPLALPGLVKKTKQNTHTYSRIHMQIHKPSYLDLRLLRRTQRPRSPFSGLIICVCTSAVLCRAVSRQSILVTKQETQTMIHSVFTSVQMHVVCRRSPSFLYHNDSLYVCKSTLSQSCILRPFSHWARWV